VYVYLFCNCVKTSGILLECGLQVHWKFGWICSHFVKSRVKNHDLGNICGMFLFFRSTLTMTYNRFPSLSVWSYLSHRRVATFLAHRDFLILRLMNTPAYLHVFTEELLGDNRRRRHYHHHHRHLISWTQ